MRLLLVAVAMLAACSDDKQDAPVARPRQPAAGSLARGDAGTSAADVDRDVAGNPFAEAGGGSQRAPVFRQPVRQGRPIDITLRSTPPGAQVAVDGTVIGNTPAFWSGVANGREHEFVFTMRGHAIARYRFVPVSSGIIHGRLEPIREVPDAGMPAPPPEVVPPRPALRSPVNPPTAPPSITNDAPAPAQTPIPGPVGPTPSADSGEPPVGPIP